MENLQFKRYILQRKMSVIFSFMLLVKAHGLFGIVSTMRM